MNESTGKLVLRIVLGLLILLHGIGKLRGGIGWLDGALAEARLPVFLKYGVYVGEVLAPLAVIAGWYSRIGAWRARPTGGMVHRVEMPTGTSGTLMRIACKAAAISAGSRLCSPFRPRGWTCSSSAPASMAALASRANSSGVQGNAGWKSRLLLPFRQACSIVLSLITSPRRDPAPAAPRPSHP